MSFVIAAQPELVCRYGADRWRHNEEVVVVCPVPGSRDILAGSLDGVIKRWDPEGRVVREYLYEELYLTALACAESFFAVSTDIGQISIFDLEEPRPKWTFLGNECGVTALAIMPDGSLLEAGKCGRISRWLEKDGLLLREEVFCGDAPIQAMVRLPRGNGCVFSAEGRLFALQVARQAVKQLGQFGEISSLACLDGKRVAIASRGRTSIDVVDLESATITKLADGGFDHIASSPDGSMLAAVRKNRLHLIDLRSGEQRELKINCRRPDAPCFTGDGSAVLLAGSLNVPQVYDVRSGRRVNEDTYHDDYVGSVQMLGPDSLLSTSGDRRVKLWDLRTGEMRAELFFRDWNLAASAKLHPEGRLLVIGLGHREQQAVEIWDIITKKRLARLMLSRGTPFQVELSGSGDYFFCRLGDNGNDRIEVYHAPTRKHVTTLHRAGRRFEDAVFHPAKPQIVTCNDLDAIELWDIESGERESVDIDQLGVEILSISRVVHDPRLLCVSSHYGHLSVVSLRGGTPWFVWEGWLPHEIRCAAISPTGKTVALGLSSGEIELLEVGQRKRKQSVRWKAHRGPVVSLAFSEDGKRLASGSLDTTVSLWKIDTVK